MTLISHPYSSLFTTFPLFFLYSALPHGLRRMKKMKMSAEYHTRRWYEEKKRLKRGKVDGYRGKSLIICLPHFHLQCLIIYRPKKPTLLSTTYPNYLSTYQLHYFYYSLFGEYDGAGGVEKKNMMMHVRFLVPAVVWSKGLAVIR